MKFERSERELDIFRRRARALAEMPPVPGESSGFSEFVECRLGRERFGLPLNRVREIQILSLDDVCRVPNAPAYTLGMANFRGQALPIIDIRGFLSLESSSLEGELSLVVVQRQNSDIGIVFDEVVGVSPIAMSDVDDHQAGANLTGITRDRMGLLDLDHLLSEGNLT